MPDPATVAATVEVVSDTLTASNTVLGAVDKIDEDAQKNCQSKEDEKKEILIQKRVEEMEKRRAQGLTNDDQHKLSRKR